MFEDLHQSGLEMLDLHLVCSIEVEVTDKEMVCLKEMVTEEELGSLLLQ